MKALTISSKGQIAIPKEIRDSLDIKEGDKLTYKLEGTDFWEFYVDKGYRCVFKQEGNVYKLYFVGTHKLIDRF